MHQIYSYRGSPFSILQPLWLEQLNLASFPTMTGRSILAVDHVHPIGTTRTQILKQIFMQKLLNAEINYDRMIYQGQSMNMHALPQPNPKGRRAQISTRPISVF